MDVDINKLILDEGAAETDPLGKLAELPAWSEETARALARQEGLTLTDEHWEVIRLLREHYRLHGNDLSGPRLLMALEERFGARGGKRRLYELFPGGPISQGTRLAGLPPPPYSKDPSFGSVE